MGKHRCNRPQNGVAKHRNQRATVAQVSEETQACGERCQLSVASERCQLSGLSSAGLLRSDDVAVPQAIDAESGTAPKRDPGE